MNVDRVRKLDYYLGVPLCLLGTALKKVGRIFGPSPNPGPPRKVLFIELSEMGSVILADPAMQKLQRSGGVELHFAIFRKNSPSLELLKTVPPVNVFIMEDASLLDVAAGSLRFWRWTREKGIDTVLDLELFSRFTALLSAFSGAGRRAGFYGFHSEGLYRGDFLTHKVAYNPHQHIAKNFIAMVNALTSDRAELPYSKSLITDAEIALRKMPVPEGARDAMLAKIRGVYPGFQAGRHPVVLFNTNASELVPLRRWPEGHFIRLTRMILESQPDVLLLLTGSAAERQEKERLQREIARERCLNFAGETSFAELPVLYSVSSFMLTNDSGPAHFASVTEMPVFVLFGPETPAIYGPLGEMTPIYAGLACSPCVSATNHRKSACNDNVCLQVITPEQVFEVLRPALERLGRGHAAKRGNSPECV